MTAANVGVIAESNNRDHELLKLPSTQGLTQVPSWDIMAMVNHMAM